MKLTPLSDKMTFYASEKVDGSDVIREAKGVPAKKGVHVTYSFTKQPKRTCMCHAINDKVNILYTVSHKKETPYSCPYLC